MTGEKMTIGKAIDQIVDALSTLDKKQQQTIIITVCSLLDLQAVAAAREQPPGQPSAIAGASPPPPAKGSVSGAVARVPEGFKHGLDIRTLKDQKQPDSARQMACIVAYYLMDHAPEAERKEIITTAEVERYFKQAGYKLPTKLEQLLIDCKKSGYFEAVARGEYKLTRVGYNLVTHSMPKGNKG